MYVQYGLSRKCFCYRQLYRWPREVLGFRVTDRNKQYAIFEFQISLFQNKAKCKIFPVKMSFICPRMKSHFHSNGLALI